MTFEDALQYPRNGDDPIKTILIGGVLGMLAFLVVPAFLVLGYLVRLLRSAMAGEAEPPVFDDWGDLLVDGLKAFVVGLGYVIVPAIVFGLSVGTVAVTAVVTGDVGPGTIAGSVVGFLVSFVLLLLAWYVVPAALANAAREDRIAAGFAWADLRPVLFSSTYATAWLLSLGLFIAAAIVVGLLNVLPPLGFVAGAFVMFYVDMVAFYLYGRAVADASSVEPAPEPAPGQPAA